MHRNNKRLRPAIISAIALALFAALGAGISAGNTLAFDTLVRAAVHRGASPFLTALATGTSELGALAVLLPLSGVLLAGLWVMGKRRPAAGFGAAMGGALLLNWLLKLAFHRSRPDPFFGVDPETFSFPSGHVLFSTCFYGALALVLASNRPPRPALGVIAAALVCSIGWSRVYLGVHYPTDVAAGFFIAVSWLAALSAAGLFEPGRAA
jgi:undecaprenyl-diphosphatase